jgi:hypothetical protein
MKKIYGGTGVSPVQAARRVADKTNQRRWTTVSVSHLPLEEVKL